MSLFLTIVLVLGLSIGFAAVSRYIRLRRMPPRPDAERFAAEILAKHRVTDPGER